MEISCGSDLLRREFEKRQRLNPKYSKRAFSRYIGINHSTLSLIFSGKRTISKRAAAQVADVLGLSAVERNLLSNKTPKGKTDEPLSLLRDYEFQDLDVEKITLISEWYHYAILSLLEIKEAVFEPAWISARLGIPKETAGLAMLRLLELGLVKKTRGKWKQTGKPLKVDNKHSTAAGKKFQKQILLKAIESLENDPRERRSVTSITFAMDPSKLEYAVEKIGRFRRELAIELEAFEGASDVYNFSLQLYPVTKDQSSKGKLS